MIYDSSFSLHSLPSPIFVQPIDISIHQVSSRARYPTIPLFNTDSWRHLSIYTRSIGDREKRGKWRRSEKEENFDPFRFVE